MRNLPALVSWVVGAKLATLYETQTLYSLKDIYDLLEISAVNNTNAYRLHNDAQRRENNGRK